MKVCSVHINTCSHVEQIDKSTEPHWFKPSFENHLSRGRSKGTGRCIEWRGGRWLRKDLRIAVATRSLNMHRGRAVGRGNKEGRGGDNVCFPTKPARLLPCFITLHVCRIRCAAMCVWNAHMVTVMRPYLTFAAAAFYVWRFLFRMQRSPVSIGAPRLIPAAALFTPSIGLHSLFWRLYLYNC